MGDAIRLRAGNRQAMPVLADREPAYVRDEQALYIGTPEGNVKVADGRELTALRTDLTALRTELVDLRAEVLHQQEILYGLLSGTTP